MKRKILALLLASSLMLGTAVPGALAAEPEDPEPLESELPVDPVNPEDPVDPEDRPEATGERDVFGR